MATIVTGEQYREAHKKMHEIDRQLLQKGGYPHDLESLSRALQAIVDGKLNAADAVSAEDLASGRLVIADFVSKIFQGWKVLEHVEQSLEVISDLEAVPFLGDDKSVHGVSGEEMKRRATVLGATLGFLDAVFSLERQARISEERKRSNIMSNIVFSGTVLANHHVEKIIPCLRPMDGRLVFVWRRLSDAWWEHDRLARLNPAARAE